MVGFVITHRHAVCAGHRHGWWQIDREHKTLTVETDRDRRVVPLDGAQPEALAQAVLMQMAEDEIDH